MNKEKQTYLSPETETLVVQTEGGAICGSPNYGVQGAAGANQGFNNYGDDF